MNRKESKKKRKKKKSPFNSLFYPMKQVDVQTRLSMRACPPKQQRKASPSLLRLLLCVPSSDRETHTETDSNSDNEKGNPEAPPLELSGATCGINTLVEMSVSGLRVLFDVLGVLFCLLYHGFLDDDCFGEIFKELVKFDECALDLLNVVVASADGAEDG